MRTEPLLGLDVASLSAVFLALLGIHVAAALVAIASGLVAMFSRKGSGRHVVSGRFYFGAILIVFASACAMSAFRWPADLPLVAAGAVAAVAASFGFIYRRLHRPGNAPHIIAMGVSYVAMLTAFYVDNGPQPTTSVWSDTSRLCPYSTSHRPTRSREPTRSRVILLTDSSATTTTESLLR